MSEGYPDYQRYAVWRGPNLLGSYNQTWAPGDNYSARFNMSNFGSLSLNAKCYTGFATATILVFSDPVTTNPLALYKWTFNVTTQLGVIVPLPGPYVVVDFNNPSGGTITGGAWMAGMNVGVQGLTYVAAANLVDGGNNSINAGANEKFVLPWVQPGPCQIHMQPNVVAFGKFLLTVNQTNDGATAGDELFNQTPSAALDTQLILPASPVLFTVTNNDTVARTVRFFATQGT